MGQHGSKGRAGGGIDSCPRVKYAHGTESNMYDINFALAHRKNAFLFMNPVKQGSATRSLFLSLVLPFSNSRKNCWMYPAECIRITSIIQQVELEVPSPPQQLPLPLSVREGLTAAALSDRKKAGHEPQSYISDERFGVLLRAAAWQTVKERL